MAVKTTVDSADVARMEASVRDVSKDIGTLSTAHQGLQSQMSDLDKLVHAIGNRELTIEKTMTELQELVKTELSVLTDKIAHQAYEIECRRVGIPLPLPEEKIIQLKTPLPMEAIGTNSNNSDLSAIKPIFVIERLNDVFGLNGWSFSTDVIESPITSKHVVVRVTIRVPEYGIVREAFGGNDMDDRGDAYKASVSDAINKIGGFLYIGMDVFKGHGPTTRNNGQRTANRSEAKVTIATGTEAVKPEEVRFTCADCKTKIEAAKASDGETYSAAQQVGISRTRKEWLADPNKLDSGPDLCGYCQRKRRSKTQAEASAPRPIR